ncbi:carboxylesterase 5A-like [Branchiostoma floridae]|uniref:Carboxylic ester hydrolase n=1 Tax=Branchiostoma floridae TaxID=7739 RepID=A0A9J7LEI2_BRAFL|nr:carboxylesterase 5A-like [Branchiostoma floridae]
MARKMSTCFRLVVPMILAALLGQRHAVYCQSPTPTVTTTYGDVRGTTVTVSSPTAASSTIFTFKGVPYAAPPVGNLRFRPPQPPTSWNDVLNATTFGPKCPQFITKLSDVFPNATIVDQLFSGANTTIDENCLHLNIYTPSLSGNSLPVMFWIHGGGFTGGSSDLYRGEALSVHQDVVVVTINYRLGVLGFLPTQLANATGNFGLLDQVRALEWVRDNIANFGGDPDKVTIFGESAGGISVSLLILSPLAEGLFRRAISESGVAITVPDEDAMLSITSSVGRSLNCTDDVNANMIDCIRSKSVESILTVPFSVYPVVDHHFLPEAPMALLQAGRFSKVDYLLGINNDEMGFILTLPLFPDLNNGMTHEQRFLGTSYLVDTVAMFAPKADKPGLINAILDEYSDPEVPDDPVSIRQQYFDSAKDYYFTAPTVSVANVQSAQSVKVYQYQFQHRPSVFWFKPPYVQADHGDEIMFVLGTPLVLIMPGVELFTEEEKKLSLDMMAYWANFARTGDPSNSAGAPTERPLVTWPRYTPDTPAYLQLRSEPAVGTALLKPEKLKFWNEVVPRYLAGDTASPAARFWGSYVYLVVGVALCVDVFAIQF